MELLYNTSQRRSDAEAGGSDHEIMAWGGWKTLKKFQKYMERARRKRLPFEVEFVSGETAAEKGLFQKSRSSGSCGSTRRNPRRRIF
jgi:hypothetical protein